MLNFIKNILNLLFLLRTLSKYQLVTHPENIKFSKQIKFLGLLICFTTYPKNLFLKPKQTFGLRLANCFKELGPIYIKFGQTLSTRPDLVGKEVADHLKSLQDNLPAFSTKIAKEKIADSFGLPISEIFSSFHETPIAAASIAQVHKAKLITGEKVAVKILRPNITKIYNNDIIFLEFIASIIAKLSKRAKRLKLSEIIAVFRDSMNFELDLRLEASAASRFVDNFANDDTIYIPKVYWNLTTEEILTTEWIDGISIYDTKKLLENKLNLEELSTKIAVIFFNQSYRDGFFHADLHPGNILVKKNGQISLIDFGIVGILSEDDRLWVAEILYAFLHRDYKLVADVHYRAGYVPQNTNLELFSQYCRAVAEPIIGKQVKDISVGILLAQLFKVTEAFGMETQPQLLLLQKTMVIIEGIGHTLNPEVNMWQLAEPWIKKWAAKNLTPEAKLIRSLRKYLDKFL